MYTVVSMHVANDLQAVTGSMHRMQVARADATRRFNFSVHDR